MIRPERMGRTSLMIRGKWGEYMAGIINRGARAAPSPLNIILIPEVVSLKVQIIIERKYCKNLYM